jgi:Na+/phosphate symporter
MTRRKKSIKRGGTRKKSKTLQNYEKRIKMQDEKIKGLQLNISLLLEKINLMEEESNDRLGDISKLYEDVGDVKNILKAKLGINWAQPIEWDEGAELLRETPSSN